MPILIVLSLVIPLVMIPQINASAAYYSAFTDINYTCNGDTYYFQTVGQNTPPTGYQFSDSVLDYVIQKDAEAFQVQIAGKNPFSNSFLGIKIAEFYNGFYSGVYQLIYNARIALNQTAQNWFSSLYSVYGWQFEFTGSDPNYDGYSLYGTAYGFRFTGVFGETIDVVLDQNGDFYGSNIISNYTFTNIDNELDWVSIHQIDGDDIWVSMGDPLSYQDFPSAYFDGNTLHFFGFITNTQTIGEYRLTNCQDSVLAVSKSSSNQLFLCMMPLDNTNHNSVLYLADGRTKNMTSYGTFKYTNWRSYLPASVTGNHTMYRGQISNTIDVCDFGLPSFYYSEGSTNSLAQNNAIAYVNNNAVSGFGDLYLKTLSYTTVPDPAPVEPGITVPSDDIPTSDPTDFDPDPDSDPDPVPGIDYPDPEPTPVPLPPIPTVVSGNDDLWPDLNDYFNTEDDIIDFTFPAVNVEFPDLSILLGNFVNSFTWVSTIITALFNGSDFSVLFSVLAFFFIAAAVLGIYKWWK